MKPLVVATLAALTLTPGMASAAPPKAAPARPATLSPADAANNLAQAERLALQSDLAWVGDYNGAINGEANDRMIAAIKAFQTRNGGKATGTLNPQERENLSAEAQKLQEHAGWKMVDDANGMRLGIPSKLAPQTSAGKSGSRWTSAQGQIQIETWRVKEAGISIAIMADREKKEPAGRKIEYTVTRPDFFVLSGLQGLKKFYVRGQIQGSEIRGLTILYDQATEGLMTPVVIAMSSAFAPFPSKAAAAAPAAPPPRKSVEYATAVVISADGVLLTDRNAIDGCRSLVVPGHGDAERIADDKDNGLALVRIYGAAGLSPLGLVSGAAQPDLVVTGVADPLAQTGGANVTQVATQLAAGGDGALSPPPASGFSGAPAFDRDGKFAGLVLLKPALTAGPAAAGNLATLAAAEKVRAFLAANNVTAYTASSQAKWSVRRLICTRN